MFHFLSGPSSTSIQVLFSREAILHILINGLYLNSNKITRRIEGQKQVEYFMISSMYKLHFKLTYPHFKLKRA